VVQEQLDRSIDLGGDVVATPALFSESSRQEYVAEPILTPMVISRVPLPPQGLVGSRHRSLPPQRLIGVGLPGVIAGLMNDWF